MVVLDKALLRKVGALALTIGPIQFVIAMAVEGAIKPNYSAFTDVISDLGVHEYAIIFNVSVALVGVLTLLGLGAVLTSFPRRRFFRPATFMLIVSGVGALGVGLFPENVHFWHGFFAALAFIGAGLALVFYSLTFWKVPEWDPFAIPTLVGGLVDLGALVVFVSSSGPVLGALSERAIVAPVLIWAPMVGIHLLRSKTSES